MMNASPLRVGLVLGTLVGLWHAGWSALVAFGLAQKLLDFVLYIHFLSLPLKVESFELTRAGVLVGMTFVAGFVVGAVGAVIWNLLHPSATTVGA